MDLAKSWPTCIQSFFTIFLSRPKAGVVDLDRFTDLLPEELDPGVSTLGWAPKVILA